MLALGLTLAALAAAPSAAPAAPAESPEDLRWARAARALLDEAAAGRPLAAALKAKVPDIARQLERDARAEGLRALWGRSVNFDAYAKGTIVEPAILDALLAAAGAPARDDRVVHAGVEHTYGYLFSTLATPFGFKRARWVNGESLEAGLGLPAGLLGPSPKEGTLLQNASYLFGRIAFRGDEAEKAALEKASGGVAPALKAYPFGKLAIRRLEETVKLEDGAAARTVVLRTDAVPFVKPSPKGAAALLVYSVVDPAAGGARIVSGFPITQSAMDQYLSPSNAGPDRPVLARYNAFVPGLSGREPAPKGTAQLR